jgi:hypothetical protein
MPSDKEVIIAVLKKHALLEIPRDYENKMESLNHGFIGLNEIDIGELKNLAENINNFPLKNHLIVIDKSIKIVIRYNCELQELFAPGLELIILTIDDDYRSNINFMFNPQIFRTVLSIFKFFKIFYAIDGVSEFLEEYIQKKIRQKSELYISDGYTKDNPIAYSDFTYFGEKLVNYLGKALLNEARSFAKLVLEDSYAFVSPNKFYSFPTHAIEINPSIEKDLRISLDNLNRAFLVPNFPERTDILLKNYKIPIQYEDYIRLFKRDRVDFANSLKLPVTISEADLKDI